MGDRFPVLQSRGSRPFDGRVDEARRVLWRAFEHGTLNEEEFASTLDRLGFGSGVADPSPDQHQAAGDFAHEAHDFLAQE
jgi:hypothetical protein